MRNIDERPIAKRRLDPAPPPVLYHFTNAASLISIVDSKQFWAGLPMQMNDAEEQDR